MCYIQRGRVISKTYLEQNKGTYPVYSSQTKNNGEIGSIDTYDFDGEYVTWTTDGAYAGTVFYRNEKFSITNICGLISPKNSEYLLAKFISYWLQIEAKKTCQRRLWKSQINEQRCIRYIYPHSIS